MNQINTKIGQLIAQIRQERGLTQAEFARRLSTSQSAVNRIEHGKQNLSIETLGRISDVLNKQLLSISSNNEVNLRIEGNTKLKGEISLKTSKNAAVALLCASLLNYGVTHFKSFPKIEEVYRIIEILESIGVSVKWINDNDLEIKRPEKLKLNNLDAVAAKKTRSVLMLIGVLMHDNANFKIPYAGGCKLGERTVTPHLFALEEFGLSIKASKGNYQINVKKKIPKEVVLYEAGNTVTNNVLLAAAKLNQTIQIHGASGDYMVQDLSYFLRKLGISIEGIGTPFLKIKGITEKIKKNITYYPTEDPIEAMFFITSAIITNSKITIKRVPYQWIALELLKLSKMGVKYEKSTSYKANNGEIELCDITIFPHNHSLKALEEKIHPNLYPGINPDNIPYFVLIACITRGRTLIHDWMYENRAIYYTELTKIGATIELADPHRVFITGPTKFSSAEVVCPPALRPASLLLIGMLATNGTSLLRNVYTINRGYEDLADRLNNLGARITILHDI